MVTLRKPFGVWVRLADGSAWLFAFERNQAEALKTARTLRLGPRAYNVWIALRLAPAHRS